MKTQTDNAVAAEITGCTNRRLSWEKQTVWDLSNGCRVTVERSHYGEMVARIDDAAGYWHCSNGYDSIPDRFSWARDWIEPIEPGHWDTIMIPKFRKTWKGDE